MFKAIKNRRISDEVIAQIQQLLIDGKLKKGERLLPERELAKKLGVSRAVLREALSALESMGILERKKGGGAYVRQFSSEELMKSFVRTKTDKELFEDLLEIREVVESKAVEWAVLRATEMDIMRMKNALEKMINSDRPRIEDDVLFHLTISAATHNEILFELSKNIGNMLYRTREKTLNLPGRKEECINEHRKIYEAIRDRDVARAVEAMKSHIRIVEKLIEKI